MFKNKKQAVCPFSTERINEQVARVTALIMIILLVSALLFNCISLLIAIAADFFIRGFSKLNHSPISYVAGTLVRSLNIPVKLVNKAPKVFAAKLGFLMMLGVCVLNFVNQLIPAWSISGMLILFASLECIFAFCAGCWMYTFLVVPFKKD